MKLTHISTTIEETVNHEPKKYRNIAIHIETTDGTGDLGK